MPTHILVNSLGLTYKTTIGISIATLPDVCKTPSPGGPVPVPYPNFANQSTLRKGTKTVKAKGKMIAIKGSEYSISFGDEPGVLGGVKSSTFKKETSWITYSFDVKMDGKNACRHTDKKFHNHKNTVDLAGNQDPALALAAKILQEIVCACDSEIKPDATDDCRTLGDRKHNCCEDKIQQHNAEKRMPRLGGEQGYNRKTGVAVPGSRMRLSGEPFIGARDAVTGAFIPGYVHRIRGKMFPDAAVIDDFGRPAQFVEFKFGCPKGVPTGKGKAPSTGLSVPTWTPGKKGKPGQLQKTRDLGKKQIPPVTTEPLLRTNDAC
jgi:uncharacterized Zn-binding protein involved in type VI secretion